jgi:Tfp pilus assembly protein PilN
MTTQALAETKPSRRAIDRRQDDRRSIAERRRNTEQPTVGIEIGESMLRVAIVSRRGTGEYVATSSAVPWRIECSNIASPEAESELTAALRQIVAETRLAGSPVRIALAGNLCITRAIVGARESLSRELQDLRDRAKLYLTLGTGAKAMATSITPLDARHHHAMLSVAAQSTLDMVARVVEGCGLVLKSIESSQVALCRVLGRHARYADHTVLVAQADDDSVHLLATNGGRLLIDYHPSGPRSLSQARELVRQHYARLVRYCRINYGQPAATVKCLVAIGNALHAGPTAAPDTLPLAVEPLDIDEVALPWKWVSSASDNSIAAAAGAALAGIENDVAQSPNLIECVLDKSRPPLLAALTKLASPIAACMLLALGIQAVNWQSARELAADEAELSLLSPVVARAEKLRVDLLHARQELDQLRNLGATMPGDSWRALLDSVAYCMPAEVWLQSLSISDLSRLTLKGSSFGESGVYDFVSYLQHLPSTRDVALLGTTSQTNRGSAVTSFEIDVLLGADDQPTDASTEEPPQ